MLFGQFWGTGAAEGVPAPFCRCSVCEEARVKGGRYIRRRSCFRVSDELMIDLGADAVCQSMIFGEISEVNHNNGNSYDALVQKIEELQFPVPTMMAYDGWTLY